MADKNLTQDGRWLKISTPLGEDVVVVDEMEGREEISRLFRFRVAGLTSAAFGPSDLLGKPVALSIERYAGTNRSIHGIATSLRFGATLRNGYQRVEIVLEPTLSVLRHNSDFRVFQQKSVIDIAKEIFAEQSITDYRVRASGTPAKRPYCVQFGETDLDFVSRLLAEEGLFYFFEHTADAHTLIIADDATGYGETAPSPLVFASGTAKGVALAQSMALDLRAIDKKAVFRRFDFTAPATPVDGTVTSALTLDSASSAWEHFHYGRDEPVAARQSARAKQEIDAADAAAEELSGESTEPTLSPGGQFTVTTEHHGALKLLSGAALSGSKFAAVSVEHRLLDPSYFNTRPVEEDGKQIAAYSNRFTAVPATRAFRPNRPLPKPLARGPQTATVVGPTADEIHTDEHGRIRVQFHWDRVGKKNAESSCFLRVVQGWAGNGWGLQFIPRVGMEVVVHFLEGDPDQPLVTGVLYNGTNKPAFALPAEMNKSGLRTRSTKTGSTETFNELSFDDTKDSEIVLFHAQKDFTREVENDDSLDVGNDQTRTIKNNRTTTISDGNDELTIAKGNRTETITKGNETLKIDTGNRTVTIAKGNDDLTLTGGNLTIGLDKGNMSVALTTGNLTEKATAGSITIEAGQGITLKCGQSTIEIKPQGVTIKGPMIAVQATAKAELSGAMVDVKGSGMTQINGALVKIN